jgi:Mn2+/Fe2+ NRAMP family transporter
MKKQKNNKNKSEGFWQVFLSAKKEETGWLAPFTLAIGIIGACVTPALLYNYHKTLWISGVNFVGVWVLTNVVSTMQYKMKQIERDDVVRLAILYTVISLIANLFILGMIHINNVINTIPTT